MSLQKRLPTTPCNVKASQERINFLEAERKRQYIARHFETVATILREACKSMITYIYLFLSYHSLAPGAGVNLIQAVMTNLEYRINPHPRLASKQEIVKQRTVYMDGTTLYEASDPVAYFKDAVNNK